MMERIEKIKQFVGTIQVTVPYAILLGAAFIGASIIASRLIAPYEISSGSGFVWRLNSVNGALCWDAQGIPVDLKQRGRCI